MQEAQREREMPRSIENPHYQTFSGHGRVNEADNDEEGNQRHRAVQFSDITENMWNRNETQTQNTVSAVASVGLSTSEGRGKGEDGTKYKKIHPINRQTNGEQLAILDKSVMGKIS